MYNKTLVIDIDGTLTKLGERKKYIQGPDKDWDKFYEACDEDLTNGSVFELIATIIRNYGANLLFCTGRPESVRKKTVSWIYDHLKLSPKDYKLIMRSNNDYRHDTVYKPEVFKKLGLDKDNVAAIIDDRLSVVNKFRELGFTVIDVAGGKF